MRGKLLLSCHFRGSRFSQFIIKLKLVFIKRVENYFFLVTSEEAVSHNIIYYKTETINSMTVCCVAWSSVKVIFGSFGNRPLGLLLTSVPTTMWDLAKVKSRNMTYFVREYSAVNCMVGWNELINSSTCFYHHNKLAFSKSNLSLGTHPEISSSS